ncbi:hypothetical protein DQ354_12850 [Arthrobacter sp. AQ5-06]|nr:hypothetical protein DQ354_12850 [Arthrobacter sp. AQ5-06]
MWRSTTGAGDRNELDAVVRIKPRPDALDLRDVLSPKNPWSKKPPQSIRQAEFEGVRGRAEHQEPELRGGQKAFGYDEIPVDRAAALEMLLLEEHFGPGLVLSAGW